MVGGLCWPVGAVACGFRGMHGAVSGMVGVVGL
jgi:hypothetical protein